MPAGVIDSARVVTLAEICEAIRTGWSWWYDPRRCKPMLRSPDGVLYHFRARAGEGFFLEPAEDISRRWAGETED